jgi:hypothetical protein
MSEEEVTLVQPQQSLPMTYLPMEISRREEPSSWMYPLFIILSVLLVQAFTVGIFVVIWDLVK